MTTRADIRRWVRPLLATDRDLVLLGRELFLTPVHHLLRGLLIDRTRSASWSTVHYAIIPLFDCPATEKSFAWSGTLQLGENTGYSFPADFRRESDQALTDLRCVDSISDFFGQVERNDLVVPRLFGVHRLSTYYRDHGVALAALGRLNEASLVLQKLTADWAEYQDVLGQAEALLAKRGNNVVARFKHDRAMAELQNIEHLLALRKLIEARDRPGIGRLLRNWERHNARLWGVEQLWEPTPFPVEKVS